jgi:hypothetical protein
MKHLRIFFTGLIFKQLPFLVERHSVKWYVSNTIRLLVVVLAIVGSVSLAHYWLPSKNGQSEQSKMSSVSTFKPLPTSGWENAADSVSAISFNYPDVSDTNALTGAARQANGPQELSDTPNGQVTSDGMYQIQFPNPSDSALYNFGLANAENTSPTENMVLTITALSGSAINSSSNTVNGKSLKDSLALVSPSQYAQLQTVAKDSSHVYKVGVSHGEAYLLSCDMQNLCSPIIQRDNATYPYLLITVSAESGWRYGGGAIDTKSHNYTVMETVLSTLNVLPQQSTQSTGSTTNNWADVPGTSKAGGQIIAVNPASRTITIGGYFATTVSGSAVPQPNATITVPSGARIFGQLGNSLTISSLHVSDWVTVYYSLDSPSTIVAIFDTSN